MAYWGVMQTIGKESNGKAQVTCSVHGKTRVMNRCEPDGCGGYKCRDDASCKQGSGGADPASYADAQKVTCSVHNKTRTENCCEPDGQGGFKCLASARCKQTGDTPRGGQWGMVAPDPFTALFCMLSGKGMGKGMGKGKGKGKGKGDMICRDMKANGVCPRGADCKYCNFMIEKFGTNDPNDQTCWNMKMKGECRLGDKCKYKH
eukprot:TRINITY_DN1019_c0_g3_i1.p1 TRINITY_DN1019_c0_g3~~TRINITY_DN1019_c0_g3_i1.p1  ORF type:complete len:231 (-),score=51.68 TRINITY_DN1019_c0_g3_i1:74-685(-)